MKFRFTERMQEILKHDEQDRNDSLERHDRELEDFLSDRVSSWGDWQSWTPRMAAVNYALGSWVEPNYGDPDDPNVPAFRYGTFRTAGPEVHARAVIVLGAGSQSDDPSDAGDTDGFVYLSLPTPSVEVAPPIPQASTGPLYADVVPPYAAGGFPLLAMAGGATWAAGTTQDAYANGSPVLPPWSQGAAGFFGETPPADLSSWIGAVTFDATSVASFWAWGASGVTFTDISPLPHRVNGFLEGTQITWTVRYFQS